VAASKVPKRADTMQGMFSDAAVALPTASSKRLSENLTLRLNKCRHIMQLIVFIG
jgi:hypothetical protein